jgi:hypothetical protein
MEENRCKEKKKHSSGTITIKDKDTIEELKRIQKELGLKHTSEVVRYLVRYWVKNELNSKVRCV